MGKHRKNKDKGFEKFEVEFLEENKESNNLNESESNKVAKRRRKKLLYQAIREQMEFYFSDANLRKDRFLMQLLEQNEDSYVPIDVFLSFNKIRTHTTKIKDIAKACSYSEIIEVKDDRTMIRRKLPICQKDNVDQCTLYIEKLPLDSDHDWIRSKFSQFGQIVYISLPRYRATEKIKGFAFVEFETPLSVIKACKFYKAAERLHDGESQEQPKHKRKRGNSENDEESSRKRSRCNTEDSESGHEIKNIVEEITTTTEEAKTEMEMTETNNETSDDDKKKKKKKRRGKKKPKLVQVEEIPSLRVMSKDEWKKWKNKYLAMKKASMLEMKKTLLNENNIPPTLASPLRTHNDRNTKVEVEKEEKNAKPFAIQFQKGVVIKLNVPNLVEDPAEFRRNLKEMGDVAYVDMNDDNVAYVRCQNPEATEAFAKTVRRKLLDVKVETLAGEDETKYWEKIHLDREKKSRKNKKQKGNKDVEKPPVKKNITIDSSKSNNKRIIFSETD